ncbi:MAG: lysine--tRNA ligase [Spirochaetaceae bacterium]
MSNMTHWADSNAEKVIRAKGDRPIYTCASGITPSGTVHIGNFREIISVELIVRALRERGKEVRFIYSWDDYDVFRKVPKNLPHGEEWHRYLRMPITLVPDPWERAENYARSNEVELEKLLPTVGVEPHYIYQAQEYRSSRYARGIRTALENRDLIRGILNEHRSEPLPPEWFPISVFSNFTNKDTTTVLAWDGEWGVTYRCEESGKEETVDLRETSAVKLLWRIDWPMRWAEEGVDFEPAGKDHHSEGGSFDTAERIVREVYKAEPPVTFQYDFIRIKGRGGKISSSSGEVVDLAEVLSVYQPEIVRYLFVSTKPNSEFAISFDLDVIKIYEDYDRTERVYFGIDEVGDTKREKESRIYELSQVRDVPKEAPLQFAFRHLCNLLLIHAGEIEAALDAYPGGLELSEEARERGRVRARCAWNWINTYAPEEFRFSLRSAEEGPIEIDPGMREVVIELRDRLATEYEERDEKGIQELVYEVSRSHGVEPKEFFPVMYRILVGKEKGPRLGGFIKTIGKERVLSLLRLY